MTRMVQCIYLKKEAPGLDFSPYPGELGKRIYDNVSKEAFEAWKKHQTMLVNENRLNLADARARQYLARQMEQFFFGTGAEQPAGYVPPSDEEGAKSSLYRPAGYCADGIIAAHRKSSSWFEVIYSRSDHPVWRYPV